MADLKWIEDFLDLAETRNFTQTADNRFVTQPALSRRIQHLEDWVGGPLFDRSTKPIQLTPEGERFLPAARDILRLSKQVGRREVAIESGLKVSPDEDADVGDVDALVDAAATSVEADEQATTHNTSTNTSGAGAGRATHDHSANEIIIVDDSAVTLSVLTRVVEKMGHKAVGFTDAREALDFLVAAPVGVLLTDCEMPDFDGFALAAAVRAAELGTSRHTPIVAVTGHSNLLEINRCFDVGMDDYLGKPIDRHELEVIVNRWLNNDETVEGIEKTWLAEVIPSDSGDRDGAAALVRTFCSTMRQQIELVANLVEEGNCTEVATILPSIKSEAFMIGAYSFGRSCGQLQKAAAACEISILLEKLGPFLASFVKLERAVRPLPSTPS